MEIKIDERLVAVFNEVVEKDEKCFDGETNLEKVVNAQLAQFFCFIDEKANHELLSEEAGDKLMEYLLEDIEEDDKVGQASLLLRELVKAAAGK